MEVAMTTFEFDWSTDLPMAIGIFSSENQTIVAANPVALELFGWTDADMGEVTLWDVVAVVDWSLLRLERARSTKGGEQIFVPAGGYLTFKRNDATEFSGWFQARDIADASGEVLYRAAVVIPSDRSSDAEEYWDLKAKKDLQDLVALFSGTAAHKLNNALAVTYGLLEKLNVSPGNLTEIVQSLNEIKRVGRDLSNAGVRGFDVSIFDEPGENIEVHQSDGKHSSVQGSRSVLLVDDQPELLEVLHDFLQATGYTVVKAKNLKEARENVRSTLFDYAVIDVELGTELGTDFAIELQESSPSTQIVLMSGFSHHFERYKDMNDMQFLRKPFAMSSLLTAFVTAGKND